MNIGRVYRIMGNYKCSIKYIGYAEKIYKESKISSDAIEISQLESEMSELIKEFNSKDEIDQNQISIYWSFVNIFKL